MDVGEVQKSRKKGYNFVKKMAPIGMISPFDSEKQLWVSSKYLQ